MERFSMTINILYLGRGVKSKTRQAKLHESSCMKRRLAWQADAKGAAKEGVVTPGRLELPTRSLGNCCSIHLSYGAILESIVYLIVHNSF